MREKPVAYPSEAAIKNGSSAYRHAVRPVLAAAFILMVPLVAMQFTDEVVWTLSDFVVMGVLVFGTGVLFELALMKTESTAYRAAAGAALVTAFLLVWVNLAVGIGGAVGAGFEPRGMARALAATAAAQAAVGAVGLVAGLGSPWHVLGLTGMFTALWAGSAWLFRYAARTRSSAGVAPTG